MRRLHALLLLAALALGGCATTDGDYSSLPPSARHGAYDRSGEPAGQPPPPVEAVPDLPPDAYADLLDRVRSGYAIEDVQSYAVDREVETYRSRPDFLDRTFKRGSRYLYYIVTELERRPEVTLSARPVGQAVQGAPVAQHDRRVVAVSGDLELPLYVVDRA